MNYGQLLSEIIKDRHADVLEKWLALQRQSLGARPDLISADQLAQQSSDVLSSLGPAAASGAGVNDAAWAPVRQMLERISTQRARQGFSPTQTATFVLSLKQPLFDAIRGRVTSVNDAADALWHATLVLDELALYTTEVAQKARDETILRQQNEMLELSTPVVTLWKGVLALPLIGTLDSERTQIVMESLLQRIVESGSTLAILDISGVPTVDTLVAQHLLKTVAAARLMGADCLISGIRPQIAQTIVHLGVDLNSVTTKATLADAFAVALKRLGLAVTTSEAARVPPAPVQ
jgi:rsbT co-antagonist protein RsbR